MYTIQYNTNQGVGTILFQLLRYLTIMRIIATLMPVISLASRKPLPCGVLWRMHYEPMQLMRDLVEGRLTQETIHLQCLGLDWFESEDYNVFINKETGEAINDF